MITKEQWDKIFLTLVPVVTGTTFIALGLWALTRPSPLGQRVYYQDGQYLVSVRYFRQWNEIRNFVQPSNPDVVAIYSQIGPDVWQCLDFVCRDISYRGDIGELWLFPSETLARGQADCEDTSFLLCSLLRNFTNAYVALGNYQGYGHAWCEHNGQVLETTYTSARPVPDPQDYCPYVRFNDHEVIELWPGALDEIFRLNRDEATKFNLLATVLEAK